MFQSTWASSSPLFSPDFVSDTRNPNIYRVKPTRWAPTSYKWSYNPYKWLYQWVTGFITPTSRVVTLLKTAWGPTLRYDLRLSTFQHAESTSVFQGLFGINQSPPNKNCWNTSPVKICSSSWLHLGVLMTFHQSQQKSLKVILLMVQKSHSQPPGICKTWVNNGIFTISTGAGSLPSTVSWDAFFILRSRRNP